MSTRVPHDVDEWLRRGLEALTYRTGDRNLTIGDGRTIHAPRLSHTLGVRVTIPLCSASPATGPFGMASTDREITCRKCAGRLQRMIPEPRQPALFDLDTKLPPP